MFVKLGEYKCLDALRKKGEMHFSPCIEFKKYEATQAKGIGDKYDGSIYGTVEELFTEISGSCTTKRNAPVELHFKECDKMPVYCLMQLDELELSTEYYNKIRKGFPEHTHALIIEDEEKFLDNVRYTFRNKAFMHKVFYEDLLSDNFTEFIFKGDSDRRFYDLKKQLKNIAFIEFESLNGKRNSVTVNSDNVHRTIYRKRTCFDYQKEYRIVLPRDSIIEGTNFNITSFDYPYRRIITEVNIFYDNKTA